MIEWPRNGEQIGPGPGRPNTPGKESGKMNRSPDKAARCLCRDRARTLTQQKINSIFTLIKGAAIIVPPSAPSRYCGSDGGRQPRPSPSLGSWMDRNTGRVSDWGCWGAAGNWVCSGGVYLGGGEWGGGGGGGDPSSVVPLGFRAASSPANTE